MDEAGGVEHQPDMAAPEHEIAAAQVPEVRGQGLAEPALLLVGVPRRRPPGLREAELDEARAIEAETGAPAPEIGRADEALGGGGVIGFDRVEGRAVAGKDVAARDPEIVALGLRRAEAGAQGEPAAGGLLQVRAG